MDLLSKAATVDARSNSATISRSFIGGLDRRDGGMLPPDDLDQPNQMPVIK
jgi:hypothetical protein